MLKEVQCCLLCGHELNSNVTWLFFSERFPDVICPRCEEKFERIETSLLSKQLEAEEQPSRWNNNHIALYRYNEAMRDYLHRYKFMKDVVLAKVFRKDLNTVFRRLSGIVVPIPLHPVKLKERTFSQVDELLNEASVPYEDVLEKLTTESQSTKNRAERLATAQLFKTKDVVKPYEYIIFDDIYTTGTTIEHARRALLEAGAKSVKSVTLIRG